MPDPSPTYGQLKQQTQAWRKATGKPSAAPTKQFLQLDSKINQLQLQLATNKLSGDAKTRAEASLAQARAEMRAIRAGLPKALK